jgi:hypothetical protein
MTVMHTQAEAEAPNAKDHPHAGVALLACTRLFAQYRRMGWHLVRATFCITSCYQCSVAGPALLLRVADNALICVWDGQSPSFPPNTSDNQWLFSVCWHFVQAMQLPNSP